MVTGIIKQMTETMVELVPGPFSSEENGPGTSSSEITGIIKQMTETMQKDLDAAVKVEDGQIKDFNELMAAKTKEVNILTKQIEIKTARVGELGLKLVNQKEDLDDNNKAFAQDSKFLADMKKNCKKKAEEW